MSADLINGLFEAVGGVLILNHCRALYRDKALAGVSVFSTAVFTSWGFWNLYYYPSRGQWWSFAGGGALVIANALWLGMMLYYIGAMYRVRFAWRLWRRVPGLGVIGALRYPVDWSVGDGDPIEDADSEISEMRA